MRRVFTTMVLCLLLLTGAAVCQDSDHVGVTLTPSEIDVGTFYSGATVDVSAELQDCDGAVIVIESENTEVELNRKGHVAGIWLNTAQLTVSDVPRVYLLAASDSLEKIASHEARESLHLGRQALQDEATIECDKPLLGSEFGEFMNLKTGDGTYNLDLHVDLTGIGTATQQVSATLPIPATVPPGVYNVVLYGFRDGTTVQDGQAELTIKRVGLAELMASLSQKHGAEYGVLAIIVAMSVGILMGIIFHSLPGSGH